MLFFLLNSLNKIHAFYQYSLNAFVTVFSRAIDVAPGEHTEQPLNTPSLRHACFGCWVTSQSCFPTLQPCTKSKTHVTNIYIPAVASYLLGVSHLVMSTNIY